MSEINEKLINYGNLETFHKSLLNDTGTDTDTTWSSNKLSGLFDGKQDTLTAGQNIDITGGNIGIRICR